jgi:hypothetical protein
MSTLRSALDDLACEDVGRLSDAELTDHLREIERAVRVLESVRAKAVAEVEARRSFAADGFLSATSWLVDRTGVVAADAARHVRLARALPEMPLAGTALGEGEISVAAATMLAAAREADAEAFDRCEEALVDAARALPARDLRRAIDHWLQFVDVDAGGDVAERRFQRRGLFVSTTIDGMVRLDGDLDPETGQTVMTALRSIVDVGSRGDDEDARRPAQRRADALGEICRRYLDSADRPFVAGERPHVTVTVDLAALERRAGGAAFEDGPLTPDAARRLACDAAVSRIITRGRSEPLEVGRRTPVVPPALRRAVVARDMHCRFPGCDRPQAWCDAHHVVHWADGGETSMSNLVLLCRRHHRLVHAGFAIRIVDGRAIFARPDGTILENRAPP